jgi:hypothetical protein
MPPQRNAIARRGHSRYTPRMNKLIRIVPLFAALSAFFCAGCASNMMARQSQAQPNQPVGSAAPIQCPDGQQFQNGQCVPIMRK